MGNSKNGKRKVKSLGTFRTKEEAHQAYIEAKAKYHPFSARIEEVNELRNQKGKSSSDDG